MRLLILLAMLSSEAFGAWTLCKKITVNGGQVTSGPHTNFTVTISGTYAYLASTGNGGSVTDAQGDDVVFYSGADCATGQLNWEVVRWTNTGVVEYHVLVAALDNGSVIYMGVGDAAVTTDQSNKTASWNSGYVAVYHFPDGTTLTKTDSTTNALNLTTAGTVNAAAGRLDGGASGWSTSNYLHRSDTAVLDITGSWTASAWINPTSCANYPQIITKTESGNSNYEMDLEDTTCLLRVIMTQSSAGKVSKSSAAISLSTLTYVVGVYDGGNVRAYINGAADGTPTAATGSPDNNAISLGVGIYNPSVPSNPFAGVLDEVRLSNVARSAGWIATEYANQNAPDTFYTMTDAGATVSRRRVIIQ